MSEFETQTLYKRGMVVGLWAALIAFHFAWAMYGAVVNGISAVLILAVFMTVSVYAKPVFRRATEVIR